MPHLQVKKCINYLYMDPFPSDGGAELVPLEDPPPTEALACRWHPVSQVKCILLLKGGLDLKSGLTSQLEQVVQGLFSR